MSKRRRHERFSLGRPWEGRLRVISEVTVFEARDAQGLDVVSNDPGVPGEVLSLELAGGGTVVSLVVCVTESRPTVSGGAVGHALRLLVLDESRRMEARGSGSEPRPVTRAEVLASPDLIAALIRETDVYVVNTSGSGCLVEGTSPLEAGTMATLTLRTGDEDLSDPVRVTRCDRIEGAGSRYLLGVEFLWTTPPGPGCLRRAARDPGRILAKPVASIVGTQPPLVM
jgi:hypothetical protein